MDAMQGDGVQSKAEQQQPIKYDEDVFEVHGDLGTRPVAQLDAAMMQSSERTAPCQPPAGEAAAVMNHPGLAFPGSATDVGPREGVTVRRMEVPGGRIVTQNKWVDKLLGEVDVIPYIRFCLFLNDILLLLQSVATATQGGTAGSGCSAKKNSLTIGSALEAAASRRGEETLPPFRRPSRATGSNNVIPDGS
ncbi:hypothetical protein SAY87_018351 [Trapa incisa]|uniref:SMP domain-containing protein n=1 Tax=Trapa incisa TaxID=236973 RepID=A0AAN7L593_9MYRT|nr:hypothetical protein SAY87_018351 [Trapa incisa]